MVRIRLVLLTCLLAVSETSLLTAQTPATTASTAPQPDLVQTHPVTPAQIHEYFVVTHAVEMAHKMMHQMVDGMQATSAPYLPKAFWDDLRSTMDTIDLEAAMVPAYQKYFSEDDMQQILAFYKSPAGQRMLEAQPLITSAATAVLQKEGQELGRQVGERHAEEITAAKKKYDEEIRAQQNSSKPQP